MWLWTALVLIINNSCKEYVYTILCIYLAILLPPTLFHACVRAIRWFSSMNDADIEG